MIKVDYFYNTEMMDDGLFIAYCMKKISHKLNYKIIQLSLQPWEVTDPELICQAAWSTRLEVFYTNEAKHD